MPAFSSVAWPIANAWSRGSNSIHSSPWSALPAAASLHWPWPACSPPWPRTPSPTPTAAHAAAVHPRQPTPARPGRSTGHLPAHRRSPRTWMTWLNVWPCEATRFARRSSPIPPISQRSACWWSTNWRVSPYVRRGRSAATARPSSSSPNSTTPCGVATRVSRSSSPSAPISSTAAWPTPCYAELLEDHQLLLGPLDEAGCREAIVRPAGEVGALFEKGLVEIILRDVGVEPGMLPLLQQALYELWLRRRGPWPLLEACQASGGVLGALQKRAQDTYQTLTEPSRRSLVTCFCASPRWARA